jgi:hypothetical protein
MRHLVLILGILAIAAGCGSATSPSVGPTASAPPGSGDLRLICGSDDRIVFAPAVLSAPGGAEQESDAAAVALREVLETSPGVPSTGWIRAGQTAGIALFVTPGQAGAEAPYHQVQLEFNGGRWTLGTVGGCSPTAFLGQGFGIATWSVDPAGPAITAETRAFDALVVEQACASGQPSDGRIAPPVIVYQADAILITFGVAPRPGGQDCPGNPPGHYEVMLAEPIGGRTLMDAAVFPPRPVEGLDGAGVVAVDYQLRCRNVDQAVCAARAAEVVADSERDNGQQVVVVEIMDAKGSYQVTFADGSGVTMIVD